MKGIKSVFKKIASYSYIFILMGSLASCSQYKVVTYPDYEEEELTDIQKDDSKYIIHQNDKIYVLTDATADSTSISGTLSPIGDDQVYYTAQDNKKTYKSKDKGVVKEIHVYMNKDASQLQEGPITISLKKVGEVKYLKKDLRTFGYVVGGLAVAMFAALMLTK